ncbi:HlyD family secretion protein [Paludibaculum fermentans]|uniref:HlyD family secretion protein n=1 Tax=Paludibaculum fermentans TaxID=1473598 RepID=UPI003EB93208
MKLHTTPAVILITSACLVGAVWTHANQSSTHLWQSAGSSQESPEAEPLHYPGELVSVASVPVPATILELEVPLNAQVRKGQVIGETEPQALPEPIAELDARGNLASAQAAVDQARDQLRDIQARAAASRARAEDLRNRMIGAELAAGEADEATQHSDMLYREGMQSQLKHDEELALQQSARQQVETQSEAATHSIGREEELEAQETAAQAALRQAEDRLRAAESAAVNPQASAVRLPVIAPADGYLVLRDQYSRDFEIVSGLTRQVEAHIPQASLSSVHIGQLATVTLDSQPNVVLQAVVEKIGELQVSATGAFYPVTLSLNNAAGLGDDSVRVTITLQ